MGLSLFLQILVKQDHLGTHTGQNDATIQWLNVRDTMSSFSLFDIVRVDNNLSGSTSS